MANLERSGRPQPNGVGSSTSSAASPSPRKVAASPGPRQVAVASGDRSKAAHSYNRRSELPEELKDSEEARAVWRAAQQASEHVPHQEAHGWLIKYRMRGSGTSKLGDLYLHPPPDERGVPSKVVRSMSALHDVLLLRHEARMGAAWEPPRQDPSPAARTLVPALTLTLCPTLSPHPTRQPYPATFRVSK